MNNTRIIKLLAYSIIIYVLAFIVWWTILLAKTEKENYILRKEVINLEQINVKDIFQSDIDEDYAKNRRMVYYEGGVFLLILLVAFFFVMRILTKQEKFIDLKRNFLLATSHEFKTPLASLRLNLQTLNHKQIDEQSKQLLLSNSIIEVSRLNNLVDNILLATKIDSKEYEFAKERIHFSTLLVSIIKHFNLPEERLIARIEDSLFLKGDESSLRVLFLNLIDNALKYSDNNSLVEVIALQQNKDLVIEVKDNGVGIPEEERKQVFERFYRIEDERIRKTKGTGLGLFLVKTMVEINEGEVLISSNKPKGTIFTIKIPAVE